MGKGTIWPSERKSATDRFTGLEVIQLTDYKSHSHHLYFTESGWYDEEQRLIFVSDRGNSTNLYSMHVESGEITQLTNYPGNDHIDACLLPDGSAVYIKLGTRIIRLDLLGDFDEKVVYEAPQGYHLGNVSASADGQHVCTCVQEDLSHRIRLDLGNGYVGHRELMEAAPHSMIIRIDAVNGGAETIYEAHRFITHINASPKEPWLMTFCHEGPWHLVDHRIWGLDLRTGEAWKIRERFEPEEKVGHEFFYPDGVTIGYHGFRTNGTNFFGSIRYDNTELEETEFHFDTWHGYADGLGQAIVDGKSAVKTLSIWRKQDGVYDGPRMLCELRCSFHSQKVHAHPRFDAQGKRVLFTSDKNGYGNLYLVHVPEDFTVLPLFTP
ncbi:PD40 domain-containing protein [Paenibacillus sp. CGMCC 1.16610]|uniref:Oligogalacturonide lyase n=1 Tax=Paenibacillus anseongense TaxID=2682845 RepID=A0ABW9U669_9BACL|nr:MULTISPECIES: oligogalacturonate lyase family protein [Paenibacillus]MBA2938671.1 PD40 domain-containing protein [Paenibacillus sp. CGMCC 1.16610]MVQ34634.1 oligogalacturonide lyase [Paenibacillus anseongense]